MYREIIEGIYWVGYVDRDIRDFHGYRTEHGSTYNSYLVQDGKTALVDAVKAPYAEQLLANISEITAPADVDFVICNHAEPDHSGGLPRVMEVMPQAELVCDAKCRDTLGRYYDTSAWKFRIVKDGDALSLGRRSLRFLETPMVHWPESMFTYVPEEKILFSMDAFGQHYASDFRFDDEEPLEAVMKEAKTYYANIVMLYGRPIERVLERAGGLDIEIIAPSHGVIWRRNLATILSAYADWVKCKPANKVVILYDTMWKSTALMAEAIAEGAGGDGVEAVLLNARETHITVIATEVLDTAMLVIGTPTLNKGMMPQVAAALTYLKGLAPVGKAGFAFGSYGWSKAGPEEVHSWLEEMKIKLLRDPLVCNYMPDNDILEECRAAGRLMQRAILTGND